MAKSKEAGKTIVEEAKERFDRCVEAESDNRDRAIDDLEFRNGEQWPSEVRKDRESDGRPCLTLDRTDQYVRQIINNIRESRPAIKVRGVDDESDPDVAEAINGMIRAIEQSCNAEIAYDWAAEYAVTMGWGYFRIATEYEYEDSFDQCIKVRRVNNPFTVYMDPNAEEPDASDAMYAFEVDWVDKEEFDRRWPGVSDQWPEHSMRGVEQQQWFEKNKVRVARYWKVNEEPYTLNMLSDGSVVEGDIDSQVFEIDGVQTEGKDLIERKRKATRRRVTWHLLTGHEELEKGEWAGKYIPIVPVLGEELNVEGEKYLRGLIRRMKDAQRQYNYWRSAHTEKVALSPQAPFIGPEGIFKGQKWKLANKRNYAFLEYDADVARDTGQVPQREMGAQVSAGDVHEMQVASQDLEAISGIHQAGLGHETTDTSGRAVFQRQSASDKSNFHFLDNLSRAMRHAGRIMVDLIPEIYDTERMVTILKPDGEEEKVWLNTSEPYFDEQKGKERQLRLDVGRYDVAVSIGPSYATQRQEAQAFMLEMLKTIPESGSLVADLLAKNSDAAGADEIAERLKAMVPPEVLAKENPQVAMAIKQAQGQVQHLQGQLNQAIQELQKKDMQLQDKTSENQRKMAEAQAEFSHKMRELGEKARQADQSFLSDIARLEFEYAKDVQGMGVESSNVKPMNGGTNERQLQGRGGQAQQGR